MIASRWSSTIGILAFFSCGKGRLDVCVVAGIRVGIGHHAHANPALFGLGHGCGDIGQIEVVVGHVDRLGGLVHEVDQMCVDAAVVVGGIIRVVGIGEVELVPIARRAGPARRRRRAVGSGLSSPDETDNDEDGDKNQQANRGPSGASPSHRSSWIAARTISAMRMARSSAISGSCGSAASAARALSAAASLSIGSDRSSDNAPTSPVEAA